MGKLLVLLALVSLVFLQLGSYLFPGDPVMWLAANSANYEAARLMLMPILAVLLVTNPPRSLALRHFVGAISVVLLVSVAYLTYNNNMGALDTLAFGAAGIAMGVVALEINYIVEDVVDLEALRQAKRNSPLIR
jgi:sorbitol-specific phosphotransferase system component IIC